MLKKLLGETDGARAKRRFKEEVAAHEQRVNTFRREAMSAGFTLMQIDFMARFLAMGEHSHQYVHGMHYSLSSPPVDGRHNDRER